MKQVKQESAWYAYKKIKIDYIILVVGTAKTGILLGEIHFILIAKKK